MKKVIIPSLQNREKVSCLLKTQLGDDNKFKDFWVSSRSSYGALVLDCRNDLNGTLEWIRAATNARFEGQVAPFCYPHEVFGPDVIFLMWDESFIDFRSAICQAKYRENFSQIDALRTLVPDWLFHQNLSDPEKRQRSIQIPNDVWSDWKTDIETKFIDSEKPCLRLMVQYPMYEKRTAQQNPAPSPATWRVEGTKAKATKETSLIIL